MEHEPHITEQPDDNGMAKVIALVSVIALMCAVGGYVVYGSGMWSPQAQHSDQ